MRTDTEKEPESSQDAMSSYKVPRDIGDFLGTYSQPYAQELRQGYADSAGAVLVNPKQIYWIRKRRIRRQTQSRCPR